MNRREYAIFNQGKIGNTTISNRIVRSPTFDGAVFKDHRIPEQTLRLYSELAAGGAGLIITGFTQVMQREDREDHTIPGESFSKKSFHLRIRRTFFKRLQGINLGPPEPWRIRFSHF